MELPSLKVLLLLVVAIICCASDSGACSPARDLCSNLWYNAILDALHEEDPEQRLSRAHSEVHRLIEERGAEKLTEFARCLFGDSDPVDTDGIEDLLMLAAYPDEVARLLDLNELKQQDLAAQTNIIRKAILEGDTKLWRGSLLDREGAIYLAAVYGLLDLNELAMEYCEGVSFQAITCERLGHLHELFTVQGSFQTRSEAVASNILAIDLEVLAEKVNTDLRYKESLKTALRHACPRHLRPRLEHCGYIQGYLCKASELSYGPYPKGASFPYARGPLDLVARLVAGPCFLACPVN